VVAEAIRPPRSADAIAGRTTVAVAVLVKPSSDAEAVTECVTIVVAVADIPPSDAEPAAVVKNCPPSRTFVPFSVDASRMNADGPSSPVVASFSSLVSSRNLLTAIAAY
jgi:hypothetical protein